MKLTVMREPSIVDINGKSGRQWVGQNEDGQLVRVTFVPSDEHLEIQVETLTLPAMPAPPADAKADK